MTETLGDRIRAGRKAKEIRQYEMAAKLGIPGARLCMMEKDRRPVSVEMLMKIAEILGCSADELLFGKRG